MRVTPAAEVEPVSAMAVFGERVHLARGFVELLAHDGVKRGLIGPRETDRIWTRHILNCAVVAPLLPEDARVVDIGSGAGLPGIPLALVRPDCLVFLVEPLERRTRFLAEVIAALGIPNCRVVRGRANEVIDECGDADVAASRALAPLHRLAGWSAPLLRPGGTLLAIKGRSASAELERDAAALTAAGLADPTVIEVGSGIVDPPTVLVRATKVAIKRS